MAQHLPDELMDGLTTLAEPLMEAAGDAAKRLVWVAEDATDDDRVGAEVVQTFVVATQALLRGLPLTELGLIGALGALSGTVMGQCVGDKRHLYAAFNAQMARTMREVSDALKPVGGMQ